VTRRGLLWHLMPLGMCPACKRAVSVYRTSGFTWRVVPHRVEPWVWGLDEQGACIGNGLPPERLA
jgi:hypothetical protein